MSCYFKTTPKDQKQHALSGRAASVLGPQPILKPHAKTQSIIYSKTWMV